MNKVILTLLVVAIAGVLYVAYKNKDVKEEVAETSSEWVLSASMICKDESYFIAEFPTSDSVDIVVDGVVARTLPRVEGEGQRFENDEFAYVFAGEEATVTNKATGALTTCSQPFDPNLAPTNFGDAGEGGGSKQDVVLMVSESIVGKWKSAEDEKFVREFSAGTFIDYHNNKEVSRGSWTAFTRDTGIEANIPMDENTVYLEMVASGTQTDRLSFKVTKLTPETLELVYMDRGGVLTFSRL